MSERAPSVLLLDSGVDAGHPGLRGGPRVHAHVLDADGRLAPEVPPRDPLGHGTAVAAVVRAHAAEIEIHVLRVFDGNGEATRSELARGLRAAQSLSVDAINCSLGLPIDAFADAEHDAVLEAACALAQRVALVVPAELATGRANALASVPFVHAVAADPNAGPSADPIPGPRERTWLASPLPPAGVFGLPAARVRGASLACARVAAWLAQRAVRGL